MIAGSDAPPAAAGRAATRARPRRDRRAGRRRRTRRRGRTGRSRRASRPRTAPSAGAPRRALSKPARSSAARPRAARSARRSRPRRAGASSASSARRRDRGELEPARSRCRRRRSRSARPTCATATSQLAARESSKASSVSVPAVTTRTMARLTTDLAPRLLRLGRALDLLGDGDAVAGADQPGEIGFGGVDRHAAHRDRRALMLAARGQRDVEAGRGDLRIVEEQFEEVAHPVEEQRSSASAFSARYCAIIGVGVAAGVRRSSRWP